jgi:hypothetical protein
MTGPGTEEVLAELDDLPKGGAWADEHPELTDDEVEAGERLGRSIDVDDDDDNGLQLLGEV